MRRDPKYPRITALRALALLRSLDKEGDHPTTWTLGELKGALEDHVKAELTKRNRRRA